MTRRRAKGRRVLPVEEVLAAVGCPVCPAGPTAPCRGGDGDEIAPHHRRTQLALGVTS